MDILKKAPEQPISQPRGPESQEAPASLKNKEVQQKMGEALQTAGVDAVEGQEGVEHGTGRVAESTSEDKKQSAGGAGKKQYTQDEIEIIRAKLLAAVPTQAVMIRQITNKLVKQETVLTKKMKKLQKDASKKAHELNLVVQSLRNVRQYFSVLAHATYEMIKHLWLKIVHGV